MTSRGLSSFGSGATGRPGSRDNVLAGKGARRGSCSAWSRGGREAWAGEGLWPGSPGGQASQAGGLAATFQPEEQLGADSAQPGQSTMSPATCPSSPATPWCSRTGHSQPGGGHWGLQGRDLAGLTPAAPPTLLPGARPGCPGCSPSLSHQKLPAASRQPHRAGPTLLRGWEAVLRHKWTDPFIPSFPEERLHRPRPLGWKPDSLGPGPTPGRAIALWKDAPGVWA